MTSGFSITILDTLIWILQSESFHVAPDKEMFWDMVWCNDGGCAYHVKLWLLVNRKTQPGVNSDMCNQYNGTTHSSQEYNIYYLCPKVSAHFHKQVPDTENCLTSVTKKENLPHQTHSCFDGSHPWDLPPPSLPLQRQEAGKFAYRHTLSRHNIETGVPSLLLLSWADRTQYKK